MAETRHQKLHTQMALMAASMNDFFNKLHWLLSQVPRDDYWRHGKAGIRPLSQRTLTTLELVSSTAHSAFFSRHITATSGHFTSSSNNLKSSSRASQAFGISRTPHGWERDWKSEASFFKSLKSSPIWTQFHRYDPYFEPECEKQEYNETI